jgi:hypothetical protein
LKLKLKSDPVSVHLLDLPKSNKDLIDEELERKMELAQRILL